jgi:hypothetical protein
MSVLEGNKKAARSAERNTPPTTAYLYNNHVGEKRFAGSAARPPSGGGNNRMAPLRWTYGRYFGYNPTSY